MSKKFKLESKRIEGDEGGDEGGESVCDVIVIVMSLRRDARENGKLLRMHVARRCISGADGDRSVNTIPVSPSHNKPTTKQVNINAGQERA